MAMQDAPKQETVAKYKDRLARAARAIPKATIRKAILSLRNRDRVVVVAGGGDIARD